MGRQHIAYQRQLEEKRKILEDAITRIGKTVPEIDPVTPSPGEVEIYAGRISRRLSWISTAVTAICHYTFPVLPVR